MTNRVLRSTPIVLTLILTMLVASWPAADVSVGAAERKTEPVLAQLTDSTIFLPLVTKAFNLPDLLIISPAAGLSVSGTGFFAAQPVEPGSVASVAFKAGTTNLGSDSTPGDGFQVYLDASTLPAGETTLTATASGPGGTATKTVNVNIVPSPPSSATVGANGATLGTASGSTIVVPPGSVGSAATISVEDKTQEQVTAEQGIRWDDLGVTFLGAINVQSSVPITKPLGVSSVGFGNRIQPGQAVVTYRIQPDSDGDGTGELVVVNGANLAPNGAIVSSPVPQIVVSGIQVAGGNGLNGAPGSVITISGSGFNPASLKGNLALFRSQVDGATLEVPGAVSGDPGPNAAQTFVTLMPPLAAGQATMTLRNLSTGAVAGPFNLSIAPAISLAQTPSETIDSFMARSITFVNSLSSEVAEAAEYKGLIGVKFGTIRQLFQQLAADPRPEVQQFLATTAIVIQGSGLLDKLPATSNSIQKQSAQEKQILDIYTAVLGTITALGAGVVLVLGGASAAPILAAVLVGIGIGIALVKLYQALEDGLNPCGPSLLEQAANALSGMGAAPASGGSGCGNTPPPSICGNVGCAGGILKTQDAETANFAGRYTVKILPRTGGGRALSPFTGVSDPGGYFFIPLIPEGQPFKAVANDNLTGATVTFEGVGPPTGKSVVMNFDFSEAQTNLFPINIGDAVSNGLPAVGAGNIEQPSGLDVYTFSAAPGQRVYFQETSGDCLSPFTWRLVDQDGVKLFDEELGGTGCGQDVGALTLSRGGSYTLAATSSQTGTYSFKLWNVPAPQQFSIAIGDTISDGVPAGGAGNIETPGVQDIYTFSASAGQTVFFQELTGDCLSPLNWRLVDQSGSQVFKQTIGGTGCGQHVGAVALSGGNYTLTVASETEGVGQESGRGTGVYSFKLWNIPAPQQFSIAVGDTISNGVPAAGAGNIETPGVQDIYTFSASAGQTVFFQELTGDCISPLNWRLVDQSGAQIFEETLGGTGCGEHAGSFALSGGNYTLTVASDTKGVGNQSGSSTGVYSFKLWSVPAPQQFNISIGNTISNGVPAAGAGNIETPGVQDIYTFSAAAGQTVFFDELTGDCLSPLSWRLVDQSGSQIFEQTLGGTGCGSDAGAFTLSGGSYTLTVASETKGLGQESGSATGVYSFKLTPQ